jgi:hypothetical protein
VEVSALGMVFNRTTKEKAESEYPGLVMASAVVKADKWLRDTRLIRRLRLKLVLEGEDPQELFVRDQTQKIERAGKDVVLVSQSVIAADTDVLALPLDGALRKSLAPFLEPTDMVQSGDPLVREKASGIAGGERDAWKLSVRVYGEVRKLLSPSFDVAFASAVEAIKQGKGDCTEYAAVFAALARSLGIPVRICYGMVNTGWGTFLFHAWNEVYAGRWIPIDAALGQVRVDATHLALYKGPGNELAGVELKILKTLGKLKLEVLEVTYGKEGE